MNAIVLGMAMLVSSTGISPAFETPGSPVVRSAFAYELPAGAATTPGAPHRILSEQSRRAWQRAPKQASGATTAKRFTKTDRFIAVVAGGCVGFIAGGAIGFAATSNRDNPDDDVSGLRGMVIGAPIGAALGAALGYRLTK